MTVADHVDLPPLDTALDDPFLALVAESLEAVGLPAEPAPPARYFTDASALGPLLAERGSSVPTVVLGPGEPEQCTSPTSGARSAASTRPSRCTPSCSTAGVVGH